MVCLAWQGDLLKAVITLAPKVQAPGVVELFDSLEALFEPFAKALQRMVAVTGKGLLIINLPSDNALVPTIALPHGSRYF